MRLTLFPMEFKWILLFILGFPVIRYYSCIQYIWYPAFWWHTIFGSIQLHLKQCTIIWSFPDSKRTVNGSISWHIVLVKGPCCAKLQLEGWVSDIQQNIFPKSIESVGCFVECRYVRISPAATWWNENDNLKKNTINTASYNQAITKLAFHSNETSKISCQ